MKEPRLFEHDNDLRAMQALVSEGISARTGTHYIHPGDLAWWYGYLEAENDIARHTYLWYGAHTLQAFAILSPGWHTLDLFVRPFLLGSGLHRQMLDWAMEKAARFCLDHGKDKFSTEWIAQNDALANEMLSARGWDSLGGQTTALARSLEGELPQAALPTGFSVRNCRGLEEVEGRALAQYRAFESEWEPDRYIARFRRWMQSPLYEPGLDIVAVNPAGEIAAFCLLWEDRANRIGLIEPMGTDPAFQRMGLGRAVVSAGLRKLQADGMKTAWINTGAHHSSALALYQSCGFYPWRELVLWTKKVEQPQTIIKLPVYEVSGLK